MLPEQAQQAVSTYASALAPDSDETLAAKGDTESFVALYRAYLTPVYRYAYARTGNKQEAEDATSATFERAWRNLPSYKPTGSFRGWLFTIAHRTLVDQLRRGYGRDTVPVESVASTLPSSAPGPE